MAWLRPLLTVSATAATTAILLPVHLVALRFKLPLRRRTALLWHRTVARSFNMRVTLTGHAPVHGPNGLLLIANHISWLDILVLGATMPLSFIAKSEVKNWPAFGPLSRWQETVYIARQERMNTKQQINAIGERLNQGDTLVLFPEGTTGDGNGLLPLKSSLFAAVTDIEPRPVVQTATIKYQRQYGLPLSRSDRPLVAWPGDIELLPHLLRALREGVLDVEVYISEPIEAEAFHSRKALCQRCQELLQDGFEKH